MRGLIGTFGDDRIGAGVLLGKAERVHEAGEENDARMGVALAQLIDYFHAIHLRHAIVGDDDIELLGIEEFQALFAIDGNFYATADLFQERAADQQSVPIVVDNRMYGVEEMRVFIGGTIGKSNRAVTGLSTDLYRLGKSRD